MAIQRVPLPLAKASSSSCGVPTCRPPVPDSKEKPVGTPSTSHRKPARLTPCSSPATPLPRVDPTPPCHYFRTHSSTSPKRWGPRSPFQLPYRLRECPTGEGGQEAGGSPKPPPFPPHPHWRPTGAGDCCYTTKEACLCAKVAEESQVTCGSGDGFPRGSQPLGRSLPWPPAGFPATSCWSGAHLVFRLLLAVCPGFARVAKDRAQEGGRALFSWAQSHLRRRARARWALPGGGRRLRTVHGNAWN